MPKNILIFADGTGQAGGLKPDQRLSNVYKLYRACRAGPDSSINPATQVAFYDPGLGTTSSDGIVRIRVLDAIKALAGSIAGLGISTNVVDCYEAILKHYEPGDRIFLFGFSRGAYTARSVAGVLNLCGVPTHDGAGGPLPRGGRALRKIAKEGVLKVYDHGAGKPRADYEDEREEQGRRFRAKYGSGGDRGDVHPYFIGLFDAVAALGLPPIVRGIVALLTVALGAAVAFAVASLGSWVTNWNFAAWLWASIVVIGVGSLYLYGRATLKFLRDFNGRRVSWHLARWTSKHYDGFLDPRVNVVRHALAVDEKRRAFDRVVWGGKSNVPRHEPGELESFQQYWFAGNHSDIGGSYAEDESRLSDISLRWMVDEATSARYPLIVLEEKLQLFPDLAGHQHCEVASVRDECYPGWWPDWLRVTWREKPREIPINATLHPSILRRFELKSVLQCGIAAPYRPISLRAHKDLATFYEPRV